MLASLNPVFDILPGLPYSQLFFSILVVFWLQLHPLLRPSVSPCGYSSGFFPWKFSDIFTLSFGIPLSGLDLLLFYVVSVRTYTGHIWNMATISGRDMGRPMFPICGHGPPIERCSYGRYSFSRMLPSRKYPSRKYKNTTSL